jgi:hypothetical protein
MQDFYDLDQGKHRSNQEYYDEFNSMVLTAAESGATIGAHPGAIDKVLNTTAVDSENPTVGEHTDAIKTATNRYLAVAFLLGADKMRYGTLVEEIENECLHNKGSSSTSGTYPTSVSESYDYICNYLDKTQVAATSTPALPSRRMAPEKAVPPTRKSKPSQPMAELGVQTFARKYADDAVQTATPPSTAM